MRKLTLTLAAACIMTLAVTPLFAYSAFFVQLGTASTEAQARASWEKLQSDYPALLDKLSYSPRTVTAMGGGSSEFRVQAGPARSREHALRICSALMAKNLECFIVETAVFDGEPSLPRMTSTAALAGPSPTLERLSAAPPPPPPAEPAPEIAAAAPPPPPPAQEAPAPAPEPEPRVVAAVQPPAEPVALPWLAEARQRAKLPPTPADTAEAKPPETPAEETDTTGPRGRVDVAEAIPVPLSAEPQPAPAVAPTPPPEQQLVTVTSRRAPIMRSELDSSVWLQISGFKGEEAAVRFSEALRAHLKNEPGLNIRVVKPVMRHNAVPPVALNVGPLREASAVPGICAFTSEYDAGLRCAAAGATAAARRSAQRGFAIQQASPPVASAPAPAAPPPYGASSHHYVQLGAWRSVAEATRRWDSLEEVHGAVLKGYTPDIRAPERYSLNARPSVRLRVGPLPQRAEADALCVRLMKRGVSCLVVAE